MSFIPSSTNLHKLLVLTEKKETLLTQVAALDKEITAVLSGGAASETSPERAKRGRKPGGSGRKRGKRGAVKELVLAALQEAGTAGTSIKDLAAKLGLKAQNLHVWMHTTGKKTGVEKVGKGLYRVASPKVEKPAEAEEPRMALKNAAKPARASRKRAVKGKKA